MTIWVDAQLSPRTARWIAANFPIAAASLRDLGLRDSSDEDIFKAAHAASAIVLTKDSDFVRLLEQHGSPPKVLFGLLAAILPRQLFSRFWPDIFPPLSRCSTVARISSK